MPVRVPASPPTRVNPDRPTAEESWDALSAGHGIVRDRPDTWTVESPKHLQALRRSGAFDAMATGTVRQALDDLLGRGEWSPPKSWGLPLVTFSAPDAAWNVPSSGRHVDSYGPDHELPGVTVFAFLTPVAARGGGTVVLPGSHRLFNRHIATTGTWRPAEVKAALGSESPWLRDLWGTGAESDRVARYVDHGMTIDGTDFRVGELTGSPGDVILMHPRTLHTPAPNSLGTPRMMLVEIINRRR